MSARMFRALIEARHLGGCRLVYGRRITHDLAELFRSQYFARVVSCGRRGHGIYEQSCESYKLLPSSRRRGFLVGGNSDHVAIERNGPVDCGILISGHHLVRIFPYPHDVVVAPDIFRFTIQKVD